MTGFADPIVGGQGNLIRQQIKSPNFNLATQTGWAILKNGDAYFFNIVATGTVTATQFVGSDFIINSAGIFFYSGIPANGNLIGSWTNSNGVDVFGNIYSKGLSLSAGNSSLTFSQTGAIIQQLYNTGNPTAGSASIEANTTGVGTSQNDFFEFSSSINIANADAAGVWLNSSNSVGSQKAYASLFYSVSPFGNINYVTVSYSGAIISAGVIAAVKPGTGTSPSVPALAEIWHTAALSASFQTGGTDQAPRYRMEPVGTGMQARLDGTAYTTGAVANGATMFTLPPAYWPLTRKRFVNATSLSGYALGGMTVGVSTTGVVTIGALGAAANEQIVLDGMTFPLD